MNDFVKAIQDIIRLLEELTAIEQEMMDASRKNRITYVEDIMKRAQAASLKLRGLEKRREQAQKNAGWDGYSFRQILDHVSVKDRQTLIPLFDELSLQITLFKSAEESARKIIEMNLHEIDVLNQQAAEGALYTRDGSKKQAPHSFTSKKI